MAILETYALDGRHGTERRSSGERVPTLPVLCPLTLVRLNGLLKSAIVVSGSVSRCQQEVEAAVVTSDVRT